MTAPWPPRRVTPEVQQALRDTRGYTDHGTLPDPTEPAPLDVEAQADHGCASLGLLLLAAVFTCLALAFAFALFSLFESTQP